MKNIRTPRTLAETEFHTGYPVYRHERSHRAADLVIAVMAVATIAAVVLGVL